MKKLTHEEFVKRVQEKHNGEIQILSRYEGALKKMRFRHVVCGYEWEAAANQIANAGTSCAKCYKGGKWTHEEYLSRLQKANGDRVIPLERYQGYETKILHRHVCGFERMVAPREILAGHECPRCSGVLITNHAEYVQRVRELYGDDVLVLGDYVKSTQKVLHRHSCGNEWETTPNNIIRGHSCARCAGVERKSHETYVKEIKKKFHGEYEVLGSYHNSHTKILHRHKICGREWLIAPTDLLSEYGCGTCHASKGEQLIRSILEKRNLTFQEQRKISDCMHKRPLIFDFIILDGEEILMGIEYDGIQHMNPIGIFGGEKAFKKTKLRDHIKDDYCNKNGIPLLRIPYWLKPEQVESMIDAAFQHGTIMLPI